MDVFDVSAEDRIPAGKSDIKKLKREGFVPGILYGEGGSRPISLKEEELRPILDKHGDNAVLNLSVNGSTIRVRVKDVQRSPVNRGIMHIDLMPEKEYLH